MKKLIISVFAALIALAAFGCTGGGTATPSPTVKPSISPVQSPAQSPVLSPSAVVSPSAALSPSADVGSMGADEPIADFKEGETVDTANLPEKVTAAIKKEYADAQITGAAYATYMDAQTYLITLSGASVDKVYVKSDGTIIPATASDPTAGQ